jgi:predicted ribosomally synthesized peptide with nif11-like leader
MGIEHARAFVEKMKSDEKFRKNVMAVANVDERLALIQSEGYDCKISEIDDYLYDNERDALFDGDEVIGMCHGWNQE